jgi:hypothetical protein
MLLPTKISQLERHAQKVRNGSTAPAAEPISLNEPADVLALISEQINAVRAAPGVDPLNRARTLRSLAALALRAMQGRDLVARLEAVEHVLKIRRYDDRDAGKRREG